MHKATATPLTTLKERLARFNRDKAGHCYGKRCAVHMTLTDWLVAR